MPAAQRRHVVGRRAHRAVGLRRERPEPAVAEHRPRRQLDRREVDHQQEQRQVHRGLGVEHVQRRAAHADAVHRRMEGLLVRSLVSPLAGEIN